MASGRDLHHQAMEALCLSDVARMRGDAGQARDHLAQALDLETKAAMMYADQLETEPTRSILFRGAATVAMRARDWRAAERMVSFALSGNPPDAIADDLRNILEDAHFGRHLLAENVAIADDEIDITIAGSRVGYGIAPMEEVFQRAEVLQALVVRANERLGEIPYRRHGRPSREIAKKSRIFVQTARAASLALRLRIGSDQHVLEGMSEASRVVSDLLQSLDAFEKRDDRALESVIPDEAYRKSFVLLARQLAPDGKSVKAVHLATQGHDARLMVSLVKEREKEPKAAGPRTESAEEPHVAYTGELRLLDSTNEESEYFLLIGDDGENRRLFAPAELMSDVIPLLYKHRVRVTVRKDGRRLVCEDMERVTSDSEESS